MTPKEQAAAQGIVNYLKRRARRVRFSRARRVVFWFLHGSNYEHRATLSSEPDGVWVNFDAEGVSGNDSLLEFERTVKNLA